MLKPASGAAARNMAINTSEMRFGIVMVSMSIAPAKIMANGNTSSTE